MVSYIGRFAPAVATSLASVKGGEPATELTSSRSNTTNGDATLAGYGLRKRLPKTYTLADYGADWGSAHWEMFEQAHEEISALIESETDRAAALTSH